MSEPEGSGEIRSATGTVDGTSSAEAVGYGWKEFTQENLLFGLALVVAGGALAFAYSGFFRGVGGNILAAGLAVLVFRKIRKLAAWMRGSPNKRIARIARWFEIKE